MATPADTAPAPAAAAAPAPRTKPKSGGPKPRLSIPLADDGSIAYDVLTPKVRTRLQRAIADPDLRPHLALPAGPPVAAAPVADEKWDADLTNLLYDALGRVLAAVAQRYGYTPAQSAVLLFTAEEKAHLAEPTGAVLDKYMPGGLSRWGPEFVLAGALLAIGVGKLQALQATTTRGPASVAPFPTSAPAPAPAGGE